MIPPVAALLLMLAAAPLPPAQRTPRQSPKVFASFDTVSGNPAMTYNDHPDMAIAACSKCGKAGQVLVATGQDVAVYDTSGKALKIESTREFVSAAGLTPDKINDPRATFDPFIGRWTFECSCSADFLIVSENNDATGPWKGVALSDSTGDLTMFPGWDRNGVYISEYQPTLASQEFALPAADVAWKGTGNIFLAHEVRFTNRPFEMRPAVDSNPRKKPADPEYLVARSGPPQNATNFPMDLIVDRIVWSGSKAAVGTPMHIPTGFLYGRPVSLRQPSGPDIRGVESHRVFSVSAHRMTIVQKARIARRLDSCFRPWRWTAAATSASRPPGVPAIGFLPFICSRICRAMPPASSAVPYLRIPARAVTHAERFRPVGALIRERYTTDRTRQSCERFRSTPAAPRPACGRHARSDSSPETPQGIPASMSRDAQQLNLEYQRRAARNHRRTPPLAVRDRARTHQLRFPADLHSL
jgi:hypothetical protein